MAGYGHSKWKGSTGGTPWMQRTLVRLAGALHPSVLYAVVSLVIPFYMLFSFLNSLSKGEINIAEEQ